MELRVRKHHWGKILLLTGCALIALTFVFLAVVISRNLPAVKGEAVYEREAKPWVLTWPSQGQAAIGTLDGRAQATFGDDTPRPIASTAKVITALVVLDAKPLIGDGETITLDQTDVNFWQNTMLNNGSNLQVAVGEQLTQRQMLEALLLISANNIADSLVRWAFGGQTEYQAAASKWLAENNITNTTIGIDASGLNPSTTSTPSDMVKIGQLALKNTVVSELVQQKSTELPIVGKVDNTNKLLDEGYRGIKTGNSEDALSCLLFAYDYEGKTLVGMVMGQPFGKAADAVRALTESAKQNLTEVTIPSGTVVGGYSTAWGESVQAVTSDSVTARVWPGEQPKITLDDIAPPEYGSRAVGILEFGNTETAIKLSGILPSANLSWRLTHLDQLQW
jgi:D-alanyl-D-alanine carboxypeptidase (penicillin-binding protein 5/6)